HKADQPREQVRRHRRGAHQPRIAPARRRLGHPGPKGALGAAVPSGIRVKTSTSVAAGAPKLGSSPPVKVRAAANTWETMLGHVVGASGHAGAGALLC